MKKILAIIFLNIFWFTNAYACSSNDIKISWYVKKNDPFYKSDVAYFDFVSSSNKHFLITELLLYTPNGDVIKSRKVNFHIKPYGKASSTKGYGMSFKDINADLVDTGSARCREITEKEAIERKKKNSLDFSAINKKKNKSWFKWWYIPIIIVIIGFVSSALDSSNTSSKTKTRKSTSPLAEGENFIFDVFEGKKPLGQTFWLAFILVNIIVTFISGLLAENYDNNFLLIGAAASNIWAGVGTWNSATNYQLEKIKKKQPYGWAYGAKILVVLNFIIFGGQLIVLITS